MCFSMRDQKEASQTVFLKAFSVDHSVNSTLQTLYLNQIPSTVHNLVFTLLQKIPPGTPPRVSVHSSVKEAHGTYTVYIIVFCSHHVFKTTIYNLL